MRVAPHNPPKMKKKETECQANEKEENLARKLVFSHHRIAPNKTTLVPDDPSKRIEALRHAFEMCFSSVSSTVKMSEQVSPFGVLRHREKATLINPLVLTRRVQNEPNVTETDAGSPKLREKCTRLFK